MRVDTICKAGLADLDCAQDCFFAEVKHPVHKRPVRNLFVWRCMQPIASHYRIPQRALLTHLRNSRHCQRLCDGKIIESSQFVPKLPPAIDISVRHIEDLVARLILAERPQGGTPKQLCVSGFLKCVPPFAAAWKPQRQPEFATHRGVCSEACHKIHWRIQARPHYEMRTQNRPARSILTRPIGHNVLLLVIVDRRDKTGLSFLCWSELDGFASAPGD